MKAYSEAMPADQVRAVERLAREIWRYGEESFSDAWLRAYDALKNFLPELPQSLFPPYRGSMPSDRSSLQALKSLISETDLILETTPELPQNRTGAARENLRAALALVDDLIAEAKMPAASAMGRAGGSTTASKYGSEHFRQLAAKRKNRAGGRPRKDQA